jgi:hypothetical protein
VHQAVLSALRELTGHLKTQSGGGAAAHGEETA